MGSLGPQSKWRTVSSRDPFYTWTQSHVVSSDFHENNFEYFCKTLISGTNCYFLICVILL
ncbi:F10B6.33 [Arabidopsis thaliana]|uniref:F10B6.33 n=1 Tax=Arabidopsis thaliana TaxID=3702 RepID=Q9LQT9_ARATH|nr:F10B6.33 [Arabidopsis thaliana]